ncbi:type II toxin-antitoxin system VapB family antitoxin [Streptomyces sp. NBC_00400]|uniref:type II toxin-antitoxin system VapB family antitoxin n=1 Tax=Streptomyces sp. NBC_00400 TaxID=2975737 RepID=UPI002E1D43D1
MSKTTVDVDPELLEAAKARLGTTTIKETINEALREIALRGERDEAIDDLAGMIRDGQLDWDVIDDKSAYRAVPSTSGEANSSWNLRREDLKYLPTLLAEAKGPAEREGVLSSIAFLLASRPEWVRQAMDEFRFHGLADQLREMKDHFSELGSHPDPRAEQVLATLMEWLEEANLREAAG